jgi:hypothetical protein
MTDIVQATSTLHDAAGPDRIEAAAEVLGRILTPFPYRTAQGALRAATAAHQLLGTLRAELLEPGGDDPPQTLPNLATILGPELFDPRSDT